ncbi:MAG: helix-turn-helix domain-containing protein [Gammaproteobacteria bacterium]
MNKREFEDLLESVRQMGAHMRGKRVRGMKAIELPVPDVVALRERLGLSQSEFAAAFGFSLRTLQNWEQGRVLPSGPSRALLTILEADPKAALKVLARVA